MATTPQATPTDPFAEFGGVATSAPAAPAPATPTDPFAEFGGVATSTPTETQPEPSFLSRAGSAVNDTVTGAAQGVLDTVHGTGELIRHGLNAVPGIDNLGNRVIPPEGQSSLNTIATPTNASQKVGFGLENIAEFMLGDEALKGMSLADKLPKISRAIEVLSKQPILRNQVIQKMIAAGVRQGAVGGAQSFVHSGGDPVRALETGAAVGTAGGILSGVGSAYDAVKGGEPSVVQQVLKGKNVVEPQAQDALRTGITAASDEAGLTAQQGPSIRASLKGHISSLNDAEDAAYKVQDDAAGTDIKQLTKNLENAQYQKSLLTKTPLDIRKGIRLDTAIKASQDEIDTATTRLQDAGIDPKEADALHMKRMAAEEFEDKILHNQNVVKGDATAGHPETVDVDNLVRESQKLADKDKFGASRLEQFMGKDGASKYMKEIRGLQQQGVHAMKAQNVALWLSKYVGVPSLLTGGGAALYEATH